MGTIGARKARVIAGHVETVLAIELLCAAQGMSLRRPLTASKATEAAIECVRKHVPDMTEDRVLHHDIEAVAELIRQGDIVTAVEQRIGALN